MALAIPGLGGVSLPSGAAIFNIAVWIFVFILIGIILGFIVLMILVGKDTRKIIELNMCNRRMNIINGRLKKNKSSGVKQLWVRKFKRYLPQLTGDTSFVKGKNDAFVLLKDKNGMYHSMKIPTYEELVNWYHVMYNIDLENAKDKDLQKIKDIYMLPNPHEDLDWLSSQAIEAEKEFRVDHWWQSPTIAYIGVGFICFMMFVVTMIISKKM